jgi:hypothetical protein
MVRFYKNPDRVIAKLNRIKPRVRRPRIDLEQLRKDFEPYWIYQRDDGSRNFRIGNNEYERIKKIIKK